MNGNVKSAEYTMYSVSEKFGEIQKEYIIEDPFFDSDEWLFGNKKSIFNKFGDIKKISIYNNEGDEILWKSKLRPLTKSNNLSLEKIKKLTDNIKLILDNSINHHGTTIFNFKFDNMKTGTYKNKLKVYGRNGKECYNCKKNIIKIKVSGRGTYIC